jgi:hypothetical protein
MLISWKDPSEPFPCWSSACVLSYCFPSFDYACMQTLQLRFLWQCFRAKSVALLLMHWNYVYVVISCSYAAYVLRCSLSPAVLMCLKGLTCIFKWYFYLFLHSWSSTRTLWESTLTSLVVWVHLKTWGRGGWGGFGSGTHAVADITRNWQSWWLPFMSWGLTKRGYILIVLATALWSAVV